MLEILAPVREELFEAEALVQKALDTAGTGAAREWIHDLPGIAGHRRTLDRYIRPALVLLTSRLYHHRPEAAVGLAAVHQFIYLAGRVHAGVSEEAAPGRAFMAYQFPVLVGDYLYGRFFTTLCDAGCHRLLGDLARVICAMNEGGLLRAGRAANRGQGACEWLDIIRLETAELTASCCRTAGMVAGAPVADEPRLHNLGLAVGMALGCLEEGHSLTEAAAYVQKALTELSLLVCHRTREPLERLIKFFPVSGCPSELRMPAGDLAG